MMKLLLPMLALSSAAVAHEEPANPQAPQVVRKVMIKKISHNPDGTSKVEVIENGDAIAEQSCPGDATKDIFQHSQSAPAPQAAKQIHTKVIICSRGGGPLPLEALKKARESIANDPQIPADAKKHVLEKLDRDIAGQSSSF